MFIRLLAQVDLSPSSSGLPGGSVLADLVRGAAYLALYACGAGLVIGAGMWAIGGLGGNPYQVMGGKRAVLIASFAAIIVGASGFLVNHFFQIGNGRGRGERFVERVHIRMADGRRQPSYDLLEWPRRDHADSSD